MLINAVRKLFRSVGPEEDFTIGRRGIEPRYEYSELSYPDSIRVFVLAASENAEASIHGELVEHRLSDVHATQGYTALSYAWGYKKGTHEIFIGNRRLPIGDNLMSALRDLRREDRPIRLWIDALCINQRDINERNHQVQQMRSVYSSALETVIYLGRQMGDNIEYSAWNFLERHATWAMNENGDADPDLPAKREIMSHFRGELSDVEMSVLKRPWFRRLWVFQEVVVSITLSIQCGGRRISWDDFCKSLLLSPRNQDRYGFSLSLVDRVDIVRDMFHTRCLYQELHGMGHALPFWRAQVEAPKHNTLDILDLLQKTRRLEASDPRDKIFGLVGISTGIDERYLVIDYSLNYRSVYTRFARGIIRATGRCDILSYVEHDFSVNRRIGFTSVENNMASWVPNWDLNKYGNRWQYKMPTILSTLDSGSDTNGLCDGDGSGDTLVVAGSVIGQIVWLSREIRVTRYDEKLFQKTRNSALPVKDKQELIMKQWDYLLDSSLFNKENCSEKGSVEHHLLSRAHETAPWASDYSSEMQLRTFDKTSIVDGKKVAIYGTHGVAGPRRLALVPANACSGDYLVDIRGARVPFTMAIAANISWSEKHEYCRLIGESVVNRACADTSGVQEKVFTIH
ncbi:heterokaryon incompatibility protein-domain-containing protein [Xylaria sp. FL1042]|nr:heterokaryon incompatibility protein-domain-containing protein [Xylaria sp. FL1042]